jgi:hypothetical protein
LAGVLVNKIQVNAMEKFEISVTSDNQNYHLEVRDYMHHKEDECKFEVFNNGQFVGSFEPDGHRGLHICKNTGILDEEVLHRVAEQLESYNLL